MFTTVGHLIAISIFYCYGVTHKGGSVMQTPFSGLKQQVKSGSLKAVAVFSDENIQKIFGHEAAEDEAVERLKEYYFKNDTFEQVSADLKLRILVGHKGIGKSALFKVASSEDEAHGILPIHVQPDDIINIDYSDNFLKSIRNWREGLIKIITDKIISNFAEGVTPDSNINGVHGLPTKRISAQKQSG